MSNKTVLVTGGAGFIGTHLCAALKARGDLVISLDNYFTSSKANEIPGVIYREGHTKLVDQLVPEAVDVVFHLGEYPRVARSFEECEVVLDLNMSGTLAVLQYWRRRPGTKLIYAGSSTKFADGGQGRDQSPYAWTKATNSELVRNFGTWFGLRYAVAYFYNVYGPGELDGIYGTVVEKFRRQALAGLPLTVVLPGHQRRHFTHVEDVVAGLLLVGDHGEGDGFGLGSEEAYSILEIAAMFGLPIQTSPERRGNPMETSLDTSKSYALGWRARRRLPDYVDQLKRDLACVAGAATT